MAHEREYQNFDIVIEKSGEKYRARVISSPSGQAAVEFDKPFSPFELENFVLRMGRPRSGMRRIDSPEMQAAKDLGERLFNTVISGEVNSCYLRSIDNVLSKNQGLRLRLHINAPEFNDYPWEFLYNPQFGQFVALSQQTPIIRYIELPYTTRALPVQTPLKILVMISSPDGYPKLDTEKEWENLGKALKPLIDRKMVVLERLEQPTLGELQSKLRQDKVHIFHYIGHGKYFEDKQDGMLLLEDENGRGVPTNGQHLGAILNDHDPLRLVVLNACEGARTSKEDPYAGVAQTLVRQGLPAVLAMQFEIFEDAAMTFAEEFYSAIVDNYSVDAALSEARKAIFASNNDVEWGTPVLFMRTPDGVLFRPENTDENAARLEAEREEQRQTKIEAEERMAREKAEREAAEKAAQEKAEQEAVEDAHKVQSYPQPAKQHDTGTQPSKSKSRNWIVYATIAFVGIALCCVSGIWIYKSLGLGAATAVQVQPPLEERPSQAPAPLEILKPTNTPRGTSTVHPTVTPKKQTLTLTPTPYPQIENSLNGAWYGLLDEPAKSFDYNMEMTINQDFNSKTFTGNIRITCANCVEENYAILDGTWDGFNFRFRESEGRHFWGTFENGHMVGFIAWNCYDCSHWGTFNLEKSR